MLLRLALATTLLLPGIAMGQDLRGGFDLSAEATLGWTSNAEGRAGGRSDAFIKHSEAIRFSHAIENMALRGALTFAETRYQRLWQENDRQGGAEFALEWRLSPESLVRAKAALMLHEEGQAIPALTGLIAAKTPYLKGRAELEIESRFHQTLMVLGLRYGATRHWDTTFDVPLLAPIRTRADTASVQGDMRLSYPLDEHLALTGHVLGLAHMISDADRTAFGTIPVRALRLAAGMAAAMPLRASFALEVGGDIVWADIVGIDPFLLPYIRSEVAFALGGGFDLETTLGTRLDFESPADGLADWVLEGRMALGYAIGQTARIEAALFASAARSLAFDVEHESTLGGELSAHMALGGNLSARAAISHAVHSGLVPSYEKTRLGLTLAAAI